MHDASSARPVGREPALDACERRGLFLVAAPADRWGIADRIGPGKAVWAECGLPAADGGVPDDV
ncbi:ATP-binding protein [Streptomyces brevispora]|uniref:hypothetical protein n=1 Tax=Streptomyces brevispora TaxID=887462 RepID=UPI00381795E4